MTPGLSENDAARRLLDDGPNELPPAPRQPLWSRILEQVREPMSLLLIAAALVSGVVLGEVLDAVAIGAIVAINVVIALVQAGRADRALTALDELGRPDATVIREGRARRVPAAELVVGDLIHIEAGDRIPADGRVTASDLLEVDESMLTGESVPVPKRPDGETRGTPDDRLLWGTFATRGRGSAEVTATGAHTELGRIAAGLRSPSPPTPLQRELARLSARLGIAAVVIAVAVFGFTLLRVGTSIEGFERSFLSAVALAVAAVPEGLPTVTLVALAVGVRRMAGHGAIVRRLPAVETLGATSIIVTDKTGTLTRNLMTVSALWSPTGGADATTVPEPIATQARAIAALANDAALSPPTGDPMEQALLRWVGEDEVVTLRITHPRLASFPLDGERMRMSTLDAGAPGPTVHVKGAPEGLVARCTAWLDADGIARALAPGDALDIVERAGELAADGMRVLALAERPVTAAAPRDASEAERDLVFVALIGLEDPVRPSAAAAVAASVGAGVRVIMATGDHPATARAIAADVGLDGGAMVTGADITAEGLPSDPRDTTVYARVEPAHKLALVTALRASGEVVAMTGDGVNDAPALHAADIGVALGHDCSDVAKEAADMVVTDADLATIVTATREGRGIYDNIRKVIDYLVAGNLSEIGVVLGALLLLPELGVPLLPLQLLWVNLLTDGLPALALGNDRHDTGLMGRGPRPADRQLLDRHRLQHLGVRGAIMATACIATAMGSIALYGREPAHTRTVLLTTLVLTHLLYAFLARRPATARLRDPVRITGELGSRWLVAAVAVGSALHLVVVTWEPARTVFRTSALGATDWLLIVLGATVALLLTALHRRLDGGSSGEGRRRASVTSVT